MPLAKEGMTVTYDALGQPIIINKDARKEPEIKIDAKRIDNFLSDENKLNTVSSTAVTHTQTK